MIDNELGKDNKNKKVNSKCQAFAWRINNKEIVVGLLMNQDAVWDWFASGVDAVTNLEVSACWGAKTGLQVCYKRNMIAADLEMKELYGDVGTGVAGLLQEELVCCRSENAGTSDKRTGAAVLLQI